MSSSSGSTGVWDIIGYVIGGVTGIAILISVIVTIVMCCKKNKQSQVGMQPGPYYPPYGAYGQQMNTGYYQPDPSNQQSQYSQQGSWNKPATTNDNPPSYSALYTGNNPNRKT